MVDLVSIIIVAHNNWPDLELAIQSSLHQSYKSIEVIVIDNDSTDRTAREVEARFGHRVRYIRQKNTGDGGGYNTGCRLSHGAYLQFMDGDDFLAPDKIEKQVATFSATPSVDIVYGDVRLFQTYAGPAKWVDWDVGQYDEIVAALLTPDASGLTGHAMLFRRRAVERTGDWDKDLYIVDRDYWLRAAMAGCRFKYCPGSLCFYRRRPGQMSGDAWAMMRGCEAVWLKALTYITHESHRMKILRLLAHLRLRMALSPAGSRSQALEKLAQSRAIDGPAISRTAYAVAWLLIVVPFGRALAGARVMKSVRHATAHFVGLYQMARIA